jgi:uncharacterized tellurite resistance protein B-like protein
MLPSANTVTLSPAQLALATQVMLYVAHIDTARTDEETALIRAFYEACARDEALPPFEPLLEHAGARPTLDSGAFPEPGQQELVLSYCLMVAYADGTLSDAEKQAVSGIAQQIGVSEARLDEMISIVQDQLLAELSKLPDAQSVAKVAEELR